MKELLKKAKALGVEVKEFIAEHEGKTLTAEELTWLSEKSEELDALDAQVKAAQLADGMISLADQPAGEVKHVGRDTSVKRLSDLLPGWDEYKTFAPIGGTVDTKTLFNAAAADAAVPEYGPMAVMPKETLLVRSVFGAGQTVTDTAKYLKQVLRTNAADFVSPTGAYPESAFEYEWQTDTLSKVGHSLPVSDDTLADRGQMAAILDGEMVYGVAYKIDRALIQADGSGETCEGLLHRTGVQAFSNADTGWVLGAADPITDGQTVSLYDIARKLIKAASSGSAIGFVPDFIGMDDDLALAMDLAKDGVGRYLEYNKDGKVWRVPVVVSPAFTVTETAEGVTTVTHHMVTGPGKTCAQVLTRRATNVEVGYVDSQFVEDCKTIKASERFIFKVPYPVAFADWSIDDADLVGA